MSNIRGEFYLDVAKGNIAGHKLKGKFGRNPSLTVGVWSTIWNGGGSYTGFNATGAETVTIVSSSADDAIDGVGMRTLRIYGLGANGLEQNEDITVTGITPVTSTLSYLRLDTAKGLTAGSNASNVGDITIAQSISTDVVFAVMPAGYNSTMIAAYTIPSDKTGYLISQRAAISNKNAAAVDMRIQIRQPQSVFTVGGEASLNSVGTGYIEQSFTIPKVVPSGTDLYIEGNASASVSVSAFLDILLVDN